MKITAKLIRSFDPCYDPSEVEEDESLEITPLEFIEQFEGRVRDKEDILWVFLRNEFMSDKDLRLFAVWCAREALKQVPNPDPVGVGSILGSMVGSRVGSMVGSMVGSRVGSRVGSMVGSMVGSKVGSKVGSMVGSKRRNRCAN